MDKLKQIISDKLLLGAFLANIAYTIGYPTVQETMIKAADSRLISLESFIGCAGIIIVGQLWEKVGEKKMMKFFPLYTMGDIISYISLCSIFMFTGNAKIYYIGQVIISLFTIKNVGFSLSFIRAKRYKDDERAKYDNLAAVLESTASLMGFGLAMIVKIPLIESLILMGLGTIIENIFMLKVYFEQKK